MQDIDFSRYYRRPRGTSAVAERPAAQSGGPVVNKLSLYLAIAFSSLAVGFIGGTQLQKNKMTREIEGKIVPDSIATANVAANAAPETEKVSDNVRVTRSEEKINTEKREIDNTWAAFSFSQRYIPMKKKPRSLVWA
jgi:hypothetical protein